MEGRTEVGIAPKKNLCTWLFNPFQYIAGGEALVIGIIIILVSGAIGSFSNSHFDGVLDFHSGQLVALWIFISEGLLNWLVMGSLLFLGGKLISKSRIRLLDVFGTQALARAPGLFTMLAALLPGYQRFSASFLAKSVKTLPVVPMNVGDGIIFAITVLVSILMLIWMVALMYRAFAVSCNTGGGKAVGVFIGALIIGEAISKVLIIAMIKANF